MARGPSVAVKWHPDLTQKERSHVGSLSQHNTRQEQPQNASKSQEKDAMEPAVVEGVFVEDRENISPRISGWNRKESSREMDSPHQDLLPVQELANSTVPIAQTKEANLEEIAKKSPELRIDIRQTSESIRGVSTYGVCSYKDDDPSSQNLKQNVGRIAGSENSGELTVPCVGINGSSAKEEVSQDQNTQVTLLSNRPNSGDLNTNDPASSINLNPQTHLGRHGRTGEMSSGDRGEERDNSAIVPHESEAKTMTKDNNNLQKKTSNEQQGNSTMIMATQPAASAAGSSNFSFAITNTSSRLTPHLNAGNPPGKHNQQDKDGGDEEAHDHSHEQTKEKLDQSHKQKQQPEKEKRSLEGSKLDQKQVNAEEHTDQTKQSYTKGGGKSDDQPNKAREQYHNSFPKISNNFSRYDPKLQNYNTRKQVGQADQDNTRNPNNQRQGQQLNNNSKNEQNSELAPYTVIQSFAARLRYNQAQKETPITLNEPVHTTRQGFPAVLIDENDYYVKLAEICKYTLVGKFTNTMPRMELVRKSFILQTQLMGGVKITHFNSRHVYIDLDNELDYQTVWTKLKMNIEGQAMRIQAWTPDFTPEEETPVVPIWVSIPGLPWHCYNKVFLTTILESIGKVLFLDSPTSQRTRGSTTRVKVQADLTKERPSHVWLGFKHSNPNKGRWLKVEYEGIPSYCFYCKHQGHKDEECTIKRRDEESRKKKELEVEKNSKERGSGKLHEQGKDQKEDTTKTPNQPNKKQKGGNEKNEDQTQPKTHMTSQQQKENIQNQEEQGQQEEIQEEQWQIQRRKHQKTQEQAISKAVWRPVTPPMQGNSSSQQHKQGVTGISILPTQNIFTNLEVQEKQERQQAGQSGIKEAASQINQPSNGNLNDQPAKNNPNNHKSPHQQTADSNKSKRTGIDLSLPIPKAPNIFNVDAGLTDEVVGGMDGGCQEIATNMQEGDTKGGNLPHVMHEGLVSDPRTDLRASKNAMNSQQQKEHTQQHVQNSGNRKQTAKEKIEEQVEKMNDKDQRKQSVSMGTESTPKSKNKPSKQKRDAAKRRQNKQQEKDFEQVQEVREELCNKFVMVDDNQGLNILPLQV
ncbi:uncharacterized protein [Solanum lycopersicum]|uniref:uncharacterized protein n=1 Tax=Solanum lycopersicum TaxID=4081 RepID=UPI003749F01A